MGDLERDLSELEALMRRLEKEYEQFFAGQLRREPAETEGQVTAIIRSWSRGAIKNSTLAFRYGTLVARYNSLRTVWSRRTREREEGRTLAAPVRGARRGAAPAPAARAAPAAAPPREPAQYLAVDPQRETKRLRELYDAYRRLRAEAGESVARLRPESFERALAERVTKIREQYGCEAVLIRVVSEGGRTRIVAKPSRGAPKKGKET